MNPSVNLHELYWGLSAQAQRRTLADNAAKHLAAMLNINLTEYQNTQWQQEYLLRSQWFDNRCRCFFNRYPQAMCIDLGAGLSTRFHRLSQSADWPQFSWVDIDLPDVIQLKAQVMPVIDNYRLVSADIFKDDWLSRSGWSHDRPLIITLESLVLNSAELIAILKYIIHSSVDKERVEILFDYNIHQNWWRRCMNVMGLEKNWISELTSMGLIIRRVDAFLSEIPSWGVSARLNQTQI